MDDDDDEICRYCGEEFSYLSKHYSQLPDCCPGPHGRRRILPERVVRPRIIKVANKSNDRLELDLPSLSGDPAWDENSGTPCSPRAHGKQNVPDAGYDGDSGDSDTDIPSFFCPPNWKATQENDGNDEPCDGSADAGKVGQLKRDDESDSDVVDGECEVDTEEMECETLPNDNPLLRDEGVILDCDSVSVTVQNDYGYSAPHSPGFFNYLTEDQQSYNGEAMYLQSDATCLRIHQFLRDINAPLCSYDRLFAILKEEAIKNNFDPKADHPSRAVLLKKLCKNSDPSLAPQTRLIELEKGDTPGKDVAEVNFFSAEAVVTHLLMDKNLCGDSKCLALDPDNPFACPKPKQPLGEVTTGSWYQEAWLNMIKDADLKDGVPVCEEGYPLFMVPLIIYLDKTGTSVMQRHGVEPVMVTLAFLTQATRNKTDLSWRPLGYMPDFDQKSRAAKAQERATLKGKGRSCRNYHRCLDAVLQSLVTLQQNKAFTMVVKLGHHYKKVTIRCPVAFIIGDTKSQDMLCCRVANYNHQARTCYACYTPFDKLSCSKNICKFVTQKEQQELLEDCMLPGKEGDKVLAAKLKATSTIRCYSKVMFSLDYGGTVHGQYRACALDMMHCCESGVMRDVCKTFIGEMPDRYKALLDQMFFVICSGQRCTGKMKCLRTNFTKGITNATLLTSNEWAGLLLSYLILAQTYQGEAILDDGRFDKDEAGARKAAVKRERKRKTKEQGSVGLFKKKKITEAQLMDLDDEERGSLLNTDGEENKDAIYVGPQCTSREFIQLAEQLLSFHAYYSQKKEFWVEGDRKGERELHKSMSIMLEQLTSTLWRGGNGWNTAKVHSTFRHVAKLISSFGRPTNCDAEVGERGLKGWAKKHAKVTNKGSSANFLQQVTKRYYEWNLFTSGAQAHGCSGEAGDVNQNDKDSSPELSAGMQGKCKYRVTYATNVDGKNTTRSDWCGSWNHTGVVQLQKEILESLTGVYFTYKDGQDPDETKRLATIVLGYTEYVNGKGNVFRAHPNYGNKGTWNDWSIIKCPNGNNDYLRNPYPDDKSAKPLPPLRDEGPPSKIMMRDYRKGHTKETLQRPQSWVQHDHGQKHVPAKIIALFVDPDDGEEMTLVHACRPWMQKNYDRTSAITESWHLQYVRDLHLRKNPTPLRPQYNIVPASSLTENIFVVEETPGIHKCLPDKEFTGHVIYITDRATTWMENFTK